MTRITPLRLMILQFSHSFLTDARTFINSILSQQNPPFGKIKGRHFDRYFVTDRQRIACYVLRVGSFVPTQDATRNTRQMPEQAVAIRQFDPIEPLA